MNSERLKTLDERISVNPRDEEAFMERGKIYWARGERRLAINDYLKAIDINPQSKARHLLEQVQDILSFFNKDLYNP